MEGEVTIVEGPSRDTMACIKTATDIDDKVVKIIKELNGDGLKLHLKDWELQGSYVLYCR